MTIPKDILQAQSEGRIPHGVSLDYLAENKDAPAIAAIIFLVCFAAVIVALRLYARLVIVRQMGADDIIAVVTMILFIPFVVLCIVLLHMGSGRHIQYIKYVLTLDTVRQTETLDYVAHILYTTALFSARLSGLAFYQRVAVKPGLLYTTIQCAWAFLVVVYLAQFFLLLFHCWPVTGLWPYAWQTEDTGYNCTSWGIVYLVNSGLSLVCDVLLLAIPSILIHQLHTPWRRKVALAFVMFPGVFVLIISAVRLWLVDVGQFEADQSWHYNPMIAIENAEIAGTLIALSAPGLKPLLSAYYKQVSSSLAGSFNINNSQNPQKGFRSSQTKGNKYASPSLPTHHTHHGHKQTEDEVKILQAGHNQAYYEMSVSEANGSTLTDRSPHGSTCAGHDIRVTDEVCVLSQNYADSKLPV